MNHYDDNTSIGGSKADFPVTEWTRLIQPVHMDKILAELCERYWKPVYAYLRRRGYHNDEAKDLVQAFFTDKVLGQQLIQKSDRTKGKFRTFLLTAVKNYAIDQQRTKKQVLPLDEQMEKPSGCSLPEEEFDRAWAEELLQQVLADLEAECKRNEKYAHWEIFRKWLLEPPPSGEKLSMNEICGKYGIADPDKAYNIIANIKRRFQAILRRRLRPLVDSDADVDAEIMKFIEIFSKSRAR